MKVEYRSGERLRFFDPDRRARDLRPGRAHREDRCLGERDRARVPGYHRRAPALPAVAADPAGALGVQQTRDVPLLPAHRDRPGGVRQSGEPETVATGEGADQQKAGEAGGTSGEGLSLKFSRWGCFSGFDDDVSHPG